MKIYKIQWINLKEKIVNMVKNLNFRLIKSYFTVNYN